MSPCLVTAICSVAAFSPSIMVSRTAHIFSPIFSCRTILEVTLFPPISKVQVLPTLLGKYPDSAAEADLSLAGGSAAGTLSHAGNTTTRTPARKRDDTRKLLETTLIADSVGFIVLNVPWPAMTRC